MNAFQKKLFTAAHDLRAKGIIVVPTSYEKSPVYKWRFGEEPPHSLEDMRRAFGFSFTVGLSVLCGTVSGNIEVIDIDCKRDLEGNLMRRFYDELKRRDEALLSSLVLARTRSGGYHFFYRCRTIDRSRHLARRPATEEELRVTPELKYIVLIETRGNKGTACIAPSPGYGFLRGSLDSIPIITEEQRETLLSAARLFNQVEEKPRVQRQVARKPFEGDPAYSPIDDFNRRGDVTALLTKHGWRAKDDERNPEKTLFLRPGDTDKSSSGNFNHTLRLFSTFSTNTRFEPETYYSPAEIFFLLECQLDVRWGGDKTPGIKELLRQGYGKSYKDQRASLKQKAR